ncbi:MAG: hypothetical protein ACYSW7_12210 [Planctomycetota bacterium]|jgi:hypothetical protein
MILDKKHNTSEVSLQGTMHAVVPINGVGDTTQAVRRLERAMAEIGQKYGITLNIMYDYPLDTPPLVKKEWIDRCRCHIEPMSDLVAMPKCKATENNKANAFEGLKRFGQWHGNADLWLTVTTGDVFKAAYTTVGYLPHNLICPFCDERVTYFNMENQDVDGKTPLDRFKSWLMERAGRCDSCSTSFTWDFKENEVLMTRAKS